jgi:hypothetical protein
MSKTRSKPKTNTNKNLPAPFGTGVFGVEGGDIGIFVLSMPRGIRVSMVLIASHRRQHHIRVTTSKS